MRSLLAVALLLFALVAPAAARSVEPFAITSQFEGQRVREWLDPTCYDDDNTLFVAASGWLAAGESWSFTSPKPVCSDKIMRAHAQFPKRLDATLTITDWHGRTLGARESVTKNRTDLTVCNTDEGESWANWSDDDPREPVTWTITAHKAGEYVLSAVLNEPWWQLESDIGYCLDGP